MEYPGRGLVAINQGEGSETTLLVVAYSQPTQAGMERELDESSNSL